MLTVTIDTNNAAFGEGHDVMGECSRILADLAEKLDLTYLSAEDFDIPLYDANGNKVGRAHFSEV